MKFGVRENPECYDNCDNDNDNDNDNDATSIRKASFNLSVNRS